MPKCLTRVVLVSVIVLAIAVLATAQQTPQPVVRLGNFLEVGTADICYHTVHHTNLTNLPMTLLFEQQHVFAGNLADDHANTSNPGGIDVFGRAVSTENPVFHTERFWIDSLFSGRVFVPGGGLQAAGPSS